MHQGGTTQGMRLISTARTPVRQGNPPAGLILLFSKQDKAAILATHAGQCQNLNLSPKDPTYASVSTSIRRRCNPGSTTAVQHPC